MPQSASQAPVKDAPRDVKSQEYLDALRHSCAHIMAQAVQELFPGSKIAIGPVIENGFYYDFDTAHRFTEADFPKIEKRMMEIALANHPFQRTDLSNSESRKYWEARQEVYKLELLEGLPEKVSHYAHDSFVDLCRGGHCADTSPIRHFKLLSVAGAYWRGDEGRPMLQRIYGTAWPSKGELDAYLQLLEEAKKRDHRRLGVELGLFSVEDAAGPGLIFWHPKGAQVRVTMEDWLRREAAERGYQWVFSPHIAHRELWDTSGHTSFYKDNMFGPIEVEKALYQLKPMNCPGHILIYRSRLRSYRDLPLRMAELGTVYRYERSGVLHGLLRVRGFTQDDAHIFCAPEDIEAEVEGCIDFAFAVLKTFGFERYALELSTWDPAKRSEYSGESGDWESAQRALESVLRRRDIPYELKAGEAAFYGPKIDVKLIDAIGRPWQLSTIQFDFNLPKKFRLEYIAQDGSRKTPLMVHRALFGSIERFFGILIEHYAGRFPVWLAPVQLKLLTLTEKEERAARELEGRFRAAGLRCELDLRNEKIGHKVREALLERVPYLAVLGPKDVAAGTLSVRIHDGKQASLSGEALIAKLSEDVRSKASTPTLP